MIRSMTGFGQAALDTAHGRYVVDLRSVNGRHLETRTRLPPQLTALEATIVAHVRSRLTRGRVDVSIAFSPSPQVPVGRLRVDRALVRQYWDVYRELTGELGIPPDPRAFFTLVAAGRQVFDVETPDFDADAVTAQLAPVLDRALDALVAMRETEGAALRDDLLARIGTIEAFHGAMSARAAEVPAYHREQLMKRIHAAGVQVDSARLAQELVLWADRCDVTEELTRLASHIGQFRAFVADPEPAGRRLEFLLQELGREVNTIGSKANFASLTGLVVEAKNELERIREQAQNIE